LPRDGHGYAGVPRGSAVLCVRGECKAVCAARGGRCSVWCWLRSACAVQKVRQRV